MPEQKDKELEVLYSLMDRLVGATTGEWRANRPLDEVHDEALAHIRTYECMALSCHQHNHTFSPRDPLPRTSSGPSRGSEGLMLPKREEGARRLRVLVQKLETVSEHHFDLGRWWGHDAAPDVPELRVVAPNGESCGSVACAFGWATTIPEFQELGLKADPANEGDDETDIIIAGRQVPFVQVGMIVHPDDCLNCERDGSPLWCSALVCDIHDDDETARFGMMATLLFRNSERREEPCDELRRRWRLARDFDQGRVYTGRWGAIPRGSVWPVAEVNEDA